MKRLAKMIQKFSVGEGADSNIRKITVTEYEKINGKNKEIRISTSERDNPFVIETENIYNEHGDLVRELYHGGVREINTYEYDVRGRKIAQYRFFEIMNIRNHDKTAVELSMKLLNQFPNLGIEELEHKHGSIIYIKTEWDYTRHIKTEYMPYLENNEVKLRLLRKFLYTNNQFNVRKRYEEYESEVLVSVIRYTYDKAGNLIKLVSTENRRYDEDTPVVYEQTKIFTYDDKNRLLFRMGEAINKTYKNNKLINKEISSTEHEEYEYFNIPDYFGINGTIVKSTLTMIYDPMYSNEQTIFTASSISIKDSNDRKVLEMYEDGEVGHTVMCDIKYYEDGMIKHDIKRTAVDCEDHLYDAIFYEYEYVEE